MRCPSCNHDNRAERRFCAECGAALAARCAAFGASNEPGEKFCGGCGERLSPVLPPAAPQLAALPLTLAPAAVPALTPAVATALRPPPAAVPSAPAPPRPRHRLAAVDWLLLGTLLPVCVFGIVMTVIHGVRGDFVLLPFVASSAPDEQSYPIVSRVLPPGGTRKRTPLRAAISWCVWRAVIFAACLWLGTCRAGLRQRIKARAR